MLVTFRGNASIFNRNIPHETQISGSECLDLLSTAPVTIYFHYIC